MRLGGGCRCGYLPKIGGFRTLARVRSSSEADRERLQCTPFRGAESLEGTPEIDKHLRSTSGADT